MKTIRLTEKNMANKLFYKNEQAIIAAYYKFKEHPRADRIARCAGISRATLHRHHKTAYNIPRDYEDYLLVTYTQKIKQYISKENSSLKSIYLCFLVFITSNKAIFKTLFEDGRRNLVKKMLHPLKPRVIINWGTSSNYDHLYNIYENEILGLIEIWSEHSFSEERLTIVLNDIMYLTRTAQRNLLPLKNLQ